ncbi:I78 family peptidase inhibitor [Streptomyces kanasensis]|uniref:I78 family peptidase inhibitor n=1 Tax=Streptomyces kanasensis TaxID=936756 RepID=UPI003701264B
MAPIPASPPAHPDDDPGPYVGLDDRDAERRARSRGWTTVRAVPPGSIITLEYVAGRINFEVRDHTVIRCWLG